MLSLSQIFSPQSIQLLKELRFIGDDRCDKHLAPNGAKPKRPASNRATKPERVRMPPQFKQSIRSEKWQTYLFVRNQMVLI